MPRQPWMMDVLADEFRGSKGFRVDAFPGWQQRGSTSFAPNYVMDHHTGPGAYNPLLNYMAIGPVHPPLCNIATSRPDGGVVRITVVAAGRANHAGQGSFPGIPTNGANGVAIGVENQNTGSQAWPDQQLEAIYRLNAVLLMHMQRSPYPGNLFHKTWAPGRKSDPVSLNLSSHRQSIANVIDQRRRPPRPADPWEEFMSSLSNTQKANLESVGSTFGPGKQERLDKLASLPVETLDRMIEVGHALAQDSGARGGAFVDATLGRHRAMREAGFDREAYDLVAGLLEGVRFMRPGEKNLNFRTLGLRLAQVPLALWREADARGWVRSWERFKENRPYSEDDLK